MEYEEHLRNTLKKGMDAESYSLHTFEALLTQSMENLGENPIIFVSLLLVSGVNLVHSIINFSPLNIFGSKNCIF